MKKTKGITLCNCWLTGKPYFVLVVISKGERTKTQHTTVQHSSWNIYNVLCCLRGSGHLLYRTLLLLNLLAWHAASMQPIVNVIVENNKQTKRQKTRSTGNDFKSQFDTSKEHFVIDYESQLQLRRKRWHIELSLLHNVLSTWADARPRCRDALMPTFPLTKNHALPTFLREVRFQSVAISFLAMGLSVCFVAAFFSFAFYFVALTKPWMCYKSVSL